MTDRRDFLRLGGAAALMAVLPTSTLAAGGACLRSRPIPGTDELLPVIGMGNSSAFKSGDAAGSWHVIRTFRKYGAKYADCGGRSLITVAEVLHEHGFGDELFLGSYFSVDDESAARALASRVFALTGKSALDLMQAYPEHAAPNWDTFRRWKAEGLARYIGVARHHRDYYDTMMRLMQTGSVDFVQVNYSPLETEAEERILPMARDLGVAVMINRPFLNGRFFDLVRGHELPGWAAEFDCESWAQFSLKFIVSHPAVNCVLTETANPGHAVDNLGAGFGRLPDSKTRRRMRQTLEELV